MGMDRNCRGIDGNGGKIDLIRGSHPPWRKKAIKRERCTNALRNWFILQFISNVELQLLGSKTLGTNVLELQFVICWQTTIKT